MSQFKRGSFESKRHSFIRSAVRSASRRWPEKTTALRAARRSRGIYECAMCHNLFKPKEIELDHKVPIVDPNQGFTTWDDYLMNLFCKAEDYQVLCITCHAAKTMTEGNIRVDKSKKKSQDILNGLW